MATQMKTMFFGKHKGKPVEQVPTDYLLWVYGSFPRLRTKLVGILTQDRGMSKKQIKDVSRKHRVLGKVPESSSKRAKRLVKPKRVRRSDDQLRANDVARAMGHAIPYPKIVLPRELRYWQKGGAK